MLHTYTLCRDEAGDSSSTGRFLLGHGGPLPKTMRQSGLTMGSPCVHGEPKFSEGQLQVGIHNQFGKPSEGYKGCSA